MARFDNVPITLTGSVFRSPDVCKTREEQIAHKPPGRPKRGDILLKIGREPYKSAGGIMAVRVFDGKMWRSMGVAPPLNYWESVGFRYDKVLFENVERTHLELLKWKDRTVVWHCNYNRSEFMLTEAALSVDILDYLNIDIWRTGSSVAQTLIMRLLKDSGVALPSGFSLRHAVVAEHMAFSAATAGGQPLRQYLDQLLAE
jgi:hypothetical protein